MDIPLAHHFWRDRTNACWIPSAFPVPEIERDLKRDYTRLVAERPPWKNYGKYTVFMDYRPEKDIYGRNITPISFAFVTGCYDPEKFAKIILPLLARTNRNALSLPISGLQDKKRETERRKSALSKKILLPIIVVGALSGVCLILFWQQPDSARAPISTKIEPNSAPPKVAAEPKIIAENITLEVTKHPDGALHHEVCNSKFLEKLRDCSKGYIKAWCDQQSGSFESWYADNESCKGQRRHFSNMYDLFNHSKIAKKQLLLPNAQMTDEQWLGVEKILKAK